METQELINALANVNINSESAEVVAKAWLRMQYTKMVVAEIAGLTVLGCVVWGIRAVWKRFTGKNPMK
jgi:hypothetical protein